MGHCSRASAVFDLGFERAGIQTLWQVERDPYCLNVLERHWPNVRRYTDVRSVHGVLAHADRKRYKPESGYGETAKATLNGTCGNCEGCLSPVDIISGGFPCQPFSVAGKRRGTADDRHLWPSMRRIIEEVRPRWVVAENVPGLITMALDAVLSDLEALGYTVGAVTIPACAVDAPHRRERLWIVAHAISDQHGSPVTRSSQEASGVSSLHQAQDESARQSIRTGAVRASDNRYVSWCNDAHDDDPADVADAQHEGRERGSRPSRADNDRVEAHQQAGQDPRRTTPRCRQDAWWLPEPAVRELADGLPAGLVRYAGRVASGVPNRANKLKALGNAIVPQIAEEIGRMILAVEQASQ